RRAASRIANLLHEPAGGGLGIDRWKRFLRPDTVAVPDRFLGYLSRASNGARSGLYLPQLGRGITGTWAQTRFRELYRAGGKPEGLTAGLYLDYKTFLPDDIL